MEWKNPSPALPEGEEVPRDFPPLRGGQGGVFLKKSDKQRSFSFIRARSCEIDENTQKIKVSRNLLNTASIMGIHLGTTRGYRDSMTFCDLVNTKFHFLYIFIRE
jgi:hypothetical protein